MGLQCGLSGDQATTRATCRQGI